MKCSTEALRAGFLGTPQREMTRSEMEFHGLKEGCGCLVVAVFSIFMTSCAIAIAIVLVGLV
jgi:hypothetical protein